MQKGHFPFKKGTFSHHFKSGGGGTCPQCLDYLLARPFLSYSRITSLYFFAFVGFFIKLLSNDSRRLFATGWHRLKRGTRNGTTGIPGTSGTTGTAEFFFYYKQISCDFHYINLHGYYFSPYYIYIYISCSTLKGS